MVYLQVAHTNDTDCDLFMFKRLSDVVAYIQAEEIEEYMITDFPMGPFNEDDYTFVHVRNPVDSTDVKETDLN